MGYSRAMVLGGCSSHSECEQTLLKLELQTLIDGAYYRWDGLYKGFKGRLGSVVGNHR